MTEELKGVYLAGIQVGDARRFCVANHRFEGFPSVMYNPEIIEQYDVIHTEGEGCLSFPGLWVGVPRYKYITIKYMDSQWCEKTATFGDEDPKTDAALLAKAIQHEIFHMDGIVLHERIRDLKKRLDVTAKITRESIKQNKIGKVPKLIEGPRELDPSNLQLLSVPETPEAPQETLSISQSKVETTVHEGIVVEPKE